MSKFFSFFILLIMLLFFGGCKKQSGNELTPTPELTSGAKATIHVNPNSSISPIASKELPIYSIQDDYSELVAVTILVSSEKQITEQTVCDSVVEALTDSNLYVKLSGVSRTEDDKVVIVDFATGTPPSEKVSEEVESLILDAFGQSLLDNIKDCNGVTFTLNNEAYMSASLSISKGEVYMKR